MIHRMLIIIRFPNYMLISPPSKAGEISPLFPPKKDGK